MLVADPIRTEVSQAQPLRVQHQMNWFQVDLSNSNPRLYSLSSGFLLFGNVAFRRPVFGKYSVSDLEKKIVTGAIRCEKSPVSAVCGIRAIWVAPSCRRKHISTQLLDALGCSHLLLCSDVIWDVRYDFLSGWHCTYKLVTCFIHRFCVTHLIWTTFEWCYTTHSAELAYPD